jgi:pyruvate dehydrogenase E1 component
MFGFRRVGDLIWAAGDARVKGFLIAGISGRTSLSGEGLQHTDGQNHLNAMAFPNVQAYDPAFAFELAAIIKEGLKRMYEDDEDLIYYITIGNQAYPMPKQPKDTDEGIVKGLYRFRKSRKKKYQEKKVNLLGSGQIMTEVLQAAETLEKDFEIPVDVWSVTSYKALYEDARDRERINTRKRENDKNFIEEQLEGESEIFVAASDYVKAWPLSIARWIPGDYIVLGTDGFGRSDTVPELRNWFEVDAKHIVFHALAALIRKELVKEKVLKKYAEENGIDPDKPNPADPL